MLYYKTLPAILQTEHFFFLFFTINADKQYTPTGKNDTIKYGFAFDGKHVLIGCVQGRQITMQYTQYYESLLRRILLASDGEALTGLWFDGQKYFGSTLASQHEKKALPVFEETVHFLA